MNEELVLRIRELDNFRLLRFFDKFGRDIVSSIDLDRESLINQMSSTARDLPEVSSVLDLSAEQAQKSLSTSDAVAVARNTLEAMASNPNFEDGLKDALDGYIDDEMPASVILALGFAASMIIVAATTRLRIKFEDGKVKGEIVKEVASTEMVTGVVESLTKAAGAVVQ